MEIKVNSLGSKIKFKEGPLIKQAILLNNRDLRKKFIKSDYPTYKRSRIPNRIVNKASEGIKFANPYGAPESESTLYMPMVRFKTELPSLDKPEFDFTETAKLKKEFKSLDGIFNQMVLQETKSQIGKSLQLLIEEEGLPIKVTSGHRPGSKTKLGRVSHHSELDAYGNPRAYDIQPFFNGKIDKSDEAFQLLTLILMSNPRVVQWFKDNGYGLLDETTTAMMQRTGATGKHFHIGPDLIALRGWRNLLTLYNLA